MKDKIIIENAKLSYNSYNLGYYAIIKFHTED